MSILADPRSGVVIARRAAAMMPMFQTTGERAGTVKCRSAFSMPITKTAGPMKRR
jgi:hypothetical protein